MHLEAVFFQVSHVVFHALLLKLSKLHIERNQLYEMSAGCLHFKKCSSTRCLKLWHTAFSKRHPSRLAKSYSTDCSAQKLVLLITQKCLKVVLIT